jgi:hypothetical protein
MPTLHQIVEHHFTGAESKAEQTRGLANVQHETGHLPVASEDQRFQMRARWFARHGITRS